MKFVKILNKTHTHTSPTCHPDRRNHQSKPSSSKRAKTGRIRDPTIEQADSAKEPALKHDFPGKIDSTDRTRILGKLTYTFQNMEVLIFQNVTGDSKNNLGI